MPENFDGLLATLHKDFDRHLDQSTGDSRVVLLLFTEVEAQRRDYNDSKHSMENQIEKFYGELSELRKEVKSLRRQSGDA